ncbi:TadE/TadG family type IV pilus assembly protein [Inquilinus sp. NPDC058860]|uniref:TadE/TadG family type IV pilus assembly protein n=1 Tax=Inquilinus sp. NPDC058860 TaxID=3346652 RepID=UPI0036A94B12
MFPFEAINLKSADAKAPTDFQSDSGLAAMEFALVAPLFLMLIFATALFGIYFGTWLAVSNAAAESARASIAGLSNTERATLAETTAKTIFAGYAPTFNWTKVKEFKAAAVAGSPNLFQVTITYDISALKLLPFSDLLTGNSLTATSVVPNGGY